MGYNSEADEYNETTGPLAVCKKCNVIMDYSSKLGFRCSSCGMKVSIEQYYSRNTYNYNETPPVGCAACGGPYPYCKTSCKLFDD